MWIGFNFVWARYSLKIHVEKLKQVGELFVNKIFLNAFLYKGKNRFLNISI